MSDPDNNCDRCRKSFKDDCSDVIVFQESNRYCKNCCAIEALRDALDRLATAHDNINDVLDMLYEKENQ